MPAITSVNGTSDVEVPEEGAAPRKVGLALSGGGFRAALFHIGVLAQLARRGNLREIEVVSTVSGGSIIGAFYYLHLRRKLMETPDAQITDDSLQIMVNTIEEDFLAAVQKNLRLRTFSNLGANLRMRKLDYSRSDRMGRLLDDWFFGPAFGGERLARWVRMYQLPFKPAGYAGQPFEHDRDNPSRRVKVPRLVINATNLNTGRAWRFSAETMGEWPRTTPLDRDIDRALPLRSPPTYDDMDAWPEAIPLGVAVAASAAVPGLFPPLSISALYDTRMQLVDGGVVDNQGVDALIEAGCTHAIVSDAGGQMAGMIRAPTSALGVIARSGAVQYGRIRQLNLERLEAALGGGAKIALIHTRKGVRQPALDYNGPTVQPAPPAPDPDPAPVHPGVQELLADMRTDLDSFSDVEARSLMLSGFLHAEEVLAAREEFKPGARAPSDEMEWDFLDLLPWAVRAPTGRYERRLKRARSRLFKPYLLHPFAIPLALLVYGLCLGPFVVAGVLLAKQIGGWVGELWRDSLGVPVLGAGLDRLVDLMNVQLWVGLLWFLAGALPLYLLIRYRVLRIGIGFAAKSLPVINKLASYARAAVALVATLFAFVSAHTLDRLFLRSGTVEALGDPPA